MFFDSAACISSFRLRLRIFAFASTRRERSTDTHFGFPTRWSYK